MAWEVQLKHLGTCCHARMASACRQTGTLEASVINHTYIVLDRAQTAS